MILDLREFDDFPVKVFVEGTSEEFQGFAPEVLKVETVGLMVTVQHSGQEYFCQGQVAASVELECSRCLTPTPVRLTAGTDFIVRSDANSAPTDRAIADDEDYVYMHGSDLRADTTEVVRQALVLSLPMKPLCAESCRGFCPSCGANLNLRTCGCATSNDDGRWSALNGLMSG